MPVSSLSFGGLTISCLLFPHEWSVAQSLVHRFPGEIEQGLSGREGRRPDDEALRHTAKISLVLSDADAHDFRQALATIGTGWFGVPIWSDRLLGSAWATRVYDPQVIVDLTTPALVAGGSGLTGTDLYAPLLVGHIDTLPDIAALTDGTCELSFTLTEDSPWAFRVGVRTSASAGTWPATLTPNWLSNPIDRPTQGLTFQSIGEQRERAIEDQEVAFRWAQDADFLLADRTALGTLLAFFVASQGGRQPFTAPWWFKPGTPTAEAPASTTARFAVDSLQLDFDTDSVATCKIRFLQVPWEISGVGGETPVQPARIFLYRFTHNLPTPQITRFTNWVRTLTRSADGDYLPAPMKHAEINEGIALAAEEITLDSFIFSGNPLTLFVPFILEAALILEVFEVENDPINPDGATLRWTGEVKKAQQTGRKITATASFLGGLPARQVPGVYIGTTCNTSLFSTRCGLTAATFKKTGTLTSKSGLTLVVATGATDAADVFAHGWVEVGSGATFERRGILNSTPGSGTQTLVIDWPLRQAASGQAVAFYPGCDLTAATCTAKFSNFARFRGHPNLPQVNLSLPSATPPTTGGKK